MYELFITQYCVLKWKIEDVHSFLVCNFLPPLQVSPNSYGE